jgi:hypothetical protein
MEQDEKLFLSLPKIEVYIPPNPVNSIEDYDFSIPPRNFIIQGETLEFFVIIHLGELFTRKSKQKKLSTSGVVSLEDQNISLDEGGLRSDIDHEAITKTPLFKEKMIRMFSQLEIRTEFMRINSKWEPSAFGKTTNSQLSKTSPVSPDEASNIFISTSFNTESETIFDPITLPNGDILYYLTTDVCMKKRHIGQQIVLAAVILPPAMNLTINDLISPSYVESRNAMRMVPCKVKLVQPLSVNIEKAGVNGNILISVSIENRHEEVVLVDNIDVNVVQTLELKDKDNGRFEDFIDIVYDKADFPLNLRENEQYNFVVSFERKQVNVTDENFTCLQHSIPEVHVLWSTPSMCGKMLSPVKLPTLLPSKKKLLITFNTETSPLKVHTIFPIHITVTNLSHQARDISLEIPLPELDREHDKFFITSPRKIDSMNTPGTPFSVDKNVSKLANNKQVGTSINLLANKPRRLSLPGDSSPRELSDSNMEDLINHKNVFSETTALIHKFEQNRKKTASIFCLDKVVSLGNIEPKGQVTTTLQCIAMRAGLFAIRNIKVVDQLSKRSYVVQEPCEILVV